MSAAKQLSAPSPARYVCTNTMSNACTFWGVWRGLDTARDTHLRGPGVPPSGTVHLVHSQQQCELSQTWETAGAPPPAAASPPGSHFWAGPAWVHSPTLAQRTPAACMQKGNREQASDKKNVLGLSAQVHTGNRCQRNQLCGKLQTFSRKRKPKRTQTSKV